MRCSTEKSFVWIRLLCSNGEDLSYLPLADRKHRLHGLVSCNGERLLYCDHVEGMGEELSILSANAISKV
jgi:ATP-dependent DNA ligase